MKAIALQVVYLMLPVLMGGLGWLSKVLVQLIAAKVHNSWLAGVLTRLDSEVVTAVREVEQTFVQNAKGPDGKLTPESAQQAFDQAMNNLKSNLGKSWWQRASKVLGAEDLTTLLGSRIEAAVNAMPAAAPAKAPPLPPHP